MANLEVTYLGLKLKNPVIIGSSGLTNSIEQIEKLEKANAGAIVLKSLFEEQIETLSEQYLESSSYNVNDTENYLKEYVKENLISEYLKLIQEAKKNISIPVIASIHCYSAGSWIDYAKRIEYAGADALELNMYVLPVDIHLTSAYYEGLYLEVLKKIKKNITIPVSFKISPYFTNLIHFAEKLADNGAAGLVLFNRYFQPDINVNNLTFGSAEIFSNSNDYSNSLRWTGIISGKLINIELAPSTGIHTGETVIKFLLAGANAVQVCSAIYKYGHGQVQTILNDIGKWMDEMKFETIQEFRGKMNYKNIPDAQDYERNQFVKYFSLNK